MSTPRALIIRTAGTNCDAELVRAFALAGAEPELVHVEALVRRPSRVDEFELIGFPGGFSYGDDIASGRVLAMKMRRSLYPALREAATRGVPMIGVCNGFQVLVQLGLLPGPAGGEWPENEPPAPTLALLDNDSARFIDRWTRVEEQPETRCIWTRGLWPENRDDRRDALHLPIAHAEGRLVASEETLGDLESSGRIALRYAEPVNGSARQIAGVCDASGRILGLMPHPERFTAWTHHPYWTRLDPATRAQTPPGLRIFQNAVALVREGLGQPSGAARVDH